MSRLEAGPLQFEARPLDLHRCISDVADLLAAPTGCTSVPANLPANLPAELPGTPSA